MYIMGPLSFSTTSGKLFNQNLIEMWFEIEMMAWFEIEMMAGSE